MQLCLKESSIAFMIEKISLVIRGPLRRDNGLAQLEDGLWIKLNFVFVSF